MKFNARELDDFARYYGFHYDICPAEAIIRDFLLDAERGLEGRASSMPMLPAYIRPSAAPPSGVKALALDAGGTNLRAALVGLGADGRVSVEGLVKTFMPGTRGRVSPEEFYDAIAGLCAPLLRDMPKGCGIGFCFSYHMDVKSDGDAVPLTFSKELDAPGVIGRPVGEGLRAALGRRGVEAPERITLLNDTAATLLAGAAQIPPCPPPSAAPVPPGPLIGLILGTGFNIAYGETRIPKINYDGGAPQIVVCEAGNFAFRYQGILDREFDALTKSPGAYTSEKALSGAYLGGLNLRVFKRAIADGVLSFRRQDELRARAALETSELNAFLHAEPVGGCPLAGLFDTDETDAVAALHYLAGIVTERAALLSSAMTAALVIKQGADNPLAPARVAAEGTTFVRYHFLRESFEARLRTLLSGPRRFYYRVVPVEQASLIGAGVAALSRV